MIFHTALHGPFLFTALENCEQQLCRIYPYSNKYLFLFSSEYSTSVFRYDRTPINPQTCAEEFRRLHFDFSIIIFRDVIHKTEKNLQVLVHVVCVIWLNSDIRMMILI